MKTIKVKLILVALFSIFCFYSFFQTRTTNNTLDDHLTGRKINASPSFVPSNLFVEGTDLYVVIDPNCYPTLIGSQYHIYVVEHMPLSDRDALEALKDVDYQSITSPGYETGTLLGGSISNNIILARTASQMHLLPGLSYQHYDVIIDFNRNGFYDEGTDIIDYSGDLEIRNGNDGGGFTLIRDPAEKGFLEPITQAYSNEEPIGFELESLVVPDYICDVWNTGDFKVQISGIITYPKSINDETNDSTYPLIVIVHGASSEDKYNHYGFRYIAKHMAAQGYIVASIDLCDDMDNECLINDRYTEYIYPTALILQEHLRRLLSANVDPRKDIIHEKIRSAIDKEKIGLIGHSRGGEAVAVLCKMLAENPNSGYSIGAVTLLAPTDYSTINSDGTTREDFCDSIKLNVPSLLLYGTRDDDTRFGDGHRIFDRSQRPRYSISFIEGNHIAFNSRWDNFSTTAIPEQRKLTKSYTATFFNTYLKKQQFYLPLFAGLVVPKSVEKEKKLQLNYTYQPKGYVDHDDNIIRLTVDNFQDTSIPFKNDLNGTNWDDQIFIEEERLRHHFSSNECNTYFPDCTCSNHYVHYSGGMRGKWSYGNPILKFECNNIDVLRYSYINLRMAQRFRKYCNNFHNQKLNVVLELIDKKKESGKIDMQILDNQIHRTDTYNFCSASRCAAENTIMQTLTVPLRMFAYANPTLNLNKLNSIYIHIKSNQGEIIIDDLEFVGCDLFAKSIPDPGDTTP